MSDCLVRRIEASSRITLRTGTQITAPHGERVIWAGPDGASEHPVRNVFVMIGAVPDTAWLDGCVELDERGFVGTGAGAGVLGLRDLARASSLWATRAPDRSGAWPRARAPSASGPCTGTSRTARGSTQPPEDIALARRDLDRRFHTRILSRMIDANASSDRSSEAVEALIARCAIGDRAAFEDLYGRTSAKLLGVSLRVLGDRAAAEDALQESFVKIWHAADRYAANGLSPMTWLITIARNTAIDHRRARGARREEGEGPIAAMPAPGFTPEQAVMAAGTASRIAHCMDELPTERSEAVRGAYLHGRSYAELAADAGVPINTMRTWLRRSLIALRECFAR